MNSFQQHVGQKIENILIFDYKEDYEFFHPDGIFILLNPNDGLLIRSWKNLIAIDYTSLKEIEDEYEFELSNSVFLNKLKDGDLLHSFIGEKIVDIKISEFEKNELLGETFVIDRTGIQGILLKTENHKFLFSNNDELCHLEIDDDFEMNPDWDWQ